MKTSIDPETLPRYLLVTNEGAVGSGDFARMWEEIFRHKSWTPGTNVFFDNRKLKVVEKGYELTEEAAKYFVSKIDAIGSGKIAVLMARTENLQFGQQFNYQIGWTEQRVQYFFDEAKAIGWIEYDSQN